MKLPIIFRGGQQAGFFAHGLGLRSGEHPLEFLENNQRPVGRRYACLVAVQDYWRMIRVQAEQANVWHYSMLEPEILDDCRAGHAVLVFDLSNEGPPYYGEVFHELYAWLANERVEPPRCIWLAQNRAIAAQAAADPQAPDPGVRFVAYDFFLKVIAELFASQTDEHPLWPDVEHWRGHLPAACGQDRLLLCLNATPRWSRVLAVAALEHFGILERALVSFSGLHYVKRGASEDEVRAFLDQQSQLAWLRPSVEKVLGLPPMTVDAFSEQGNELIGRIDPRPYARTYFSLITETDFTDGTVDRITEKTAKAFCMGHPALVVGNPQALRHVTALGFQDWDSVFDRSTDGVADPAERFLLIAAELLRQTSGLRQDPVSWLEATREVSRFNIEHAFSGRFLLECQRTMDTPAINEVFSALA